MAISLDQVAGVETAVSFDFISNSAESGQDFSGVSGRLVFPEGVTRQFINFDMVDDSRDEADETFAIVFRDSEGLTIPDVPLNITILDDDPAPRLRIISSDLTEGEDGEITFSLDAPSDQTVSFTASLAADSALIPEDILPTRQTFTFAPGETGAANLDHQSHFR